MDYNTKTIYNQIFEKKCTKEYLADLLGKTQKTVENKIKELPDIKWSKKSQAYHFIDLLPAYISHKHLFSLVMGNITNAGIRKDLEAVLEKTNEVERVMVETANFSTALKTLIRLRVAITHCADVKFTYIGYRQEREVKYVRPYRVFVSNGIFYLYGEYIPKNKKSVGEFRSFALNSISELELVDYHDEDISKEGDLNAFGGFFDKDKSVDLVFEGFAAIFLKREGLSGFNWDFLSEDPDNKTHIRLYYSNEREVVTLVQKWMPMISFENPEGENEREIVSVIEENFKKWEK